MGPNAANTCAALLLHPQFGEVFRFALSQLRHERRRSVLTGAGISAVLAVILILEGFEQGIYAQLRTSVHDRGGDLIATQAGVANMAAVRSVIPQLARDQVEDVAGVSSVHPLTGLSVIYRSAGRRTALFLMVYDTAGGPSEVSAGHLIDGERQIIVDRSLANMFELAPGDAMVISGFRFEIAGLTDDKVAVFTPYAFVTFDTLIDFYFESDLAADLSAFPLVSYLRIDLEPGADRESVAAEIERTVPSVDVFSPGQLAANDEAFGRAMFAPILRTLITMAYLCGALVVGLFAFAATTARRRDLGVLKALGYTNGALLRGVAVETAVLTAAAVPLGIALAYLASLVIGAAAPVYLVLPIEPGPLVRTLAACGVFALLGALAPLPFIRNLEPVMVFQS